jgi:uncharacterized protein with HEPN domain
MMASRTTELLLDDIVHASDKILMYTRGMSYFDFSADDKTVDAVVRNIEIINEAANKIPEVYKTAHPEIDWKDIASYTERTVLDTSVINYEMAWKIREEDASALLEQMSVLSNEGKHNALRRNKS